MRLVVPEHVVRRRFADESIVLNLRTGRYHGLNETAAAMLDALEAGAAPADLAAEIATASGAPRERVEADIAGLIQGLADRELVELRDEDAP